MEHQLLIGKYTLESLTSGLYVSPLDLYREYVQNASDSIDKAIDEGLISGERAVIKIETDAVKRVIRITDNGTGVSSKNVMQALIDIGNSHKRNSQCRGFRGIGRLSGLGYCRKLRFVTSAYGESVATIVSYDCEVLHELLSPKRGNHDTVDDVLQQVMSVDSFTERKKLHYFVVELSDIDNDSCLLDKDKVLSYLQQNLPIPYAKDFVWGTLINEKMRQASCEISSYNIQFNYNDEKLALFKPYMNAVLSDRMRRIEDRISEIRFRKFYIGNVLSAVLWYAETSYLGTVLNNDIKGIRIRQGNILIGDNTSLRKQFKEERFSGWLIGELHVLDERIVPNTRRDGYEENAFYEELMDQFAGWAVEISKEIRHKSYVRSLSQQEKAVLEQPKAIDTLSVLKNQTLVNASELDIDDMDESESVANGDLLKQLSILMNMGKKITKYNVLNVNPKMTIEQKQTVARIFDILYDNYSKTKANGIVQSILENF